MSKPICLNYRLTVDDLTEGEMTLRQALKTRSRMMAFVLTISGFAFAILWMSPGPPRRGLAQDKWLNPVILVVPIGLIVGVFVVNSRAMLKRHNMKRLKSIPDFDTVVHWSITDDELYSASHLSECRNRWETIKRVVEARRGFVVFNTNGTLLFFPSRAFLSREDLDRFIALAREKVSRYDILAPIEWNPAVDESLFR